MSPSSDEALLACTASVWQGDLSRCRWCDSELTGRRTRWCSDRCAADFGRNHWWTAASRAASWAASRRDGKQCVECRVDPQTAYRAAIAHGWTFNARRYLTIQVHHVTPVLGRHAQTGCHHHLDGLETLCLHHHVERHHGLKVEQLALVAA